MSQLVRLEGKHTYQNAHCAMWTLSSESTVIFPATRLPVEAQFHQSFVSPHWSQTLWFWTTRQKLSTFSSSHVPLRPTSSKGTQKRATNMHTSQLTSVITSARWMLLKCRLKAFSQHETTPHWQHSTNSSTQPSSSNISKRTSLHSHWRPPTTSSTASPSLPLWNHYSSCHPSSPNSAV